MKKEKKDKDFVKTAYYEGGRAAMDAFFKKELKYPAEALASKTEGTVTIRYTVDYKGKVIEANVISGIGHGCDEESLRLVRLLRFNIPEDGKIKSKYSRKLNIHFRLPGSPAVLPPTKKGSLPAGNLQVNYQVTVKPPAPALVTVKKSTSYQITLPIPPKREH